jgi:hypothetical protein
VRFYGVVDSSLEEAVELFLRREDAARAKLDAAAGAELTAARRLPGRPAQWTFVTLILKPAKFMPTPVGEPLARTPCICACTV